MLSRVAIMMASATLQTPLDSSLSSLSSSPSSPSYVTTATPMTYRDVEKSCEDAVTLMELVAELLVLRSGSKVRALYPVARAGESYTKSRDAIIANTKGLAISIKDVTRYLQKENLPEVESIVQQIAEQVAVLTEAAAHAAYLAAMCDVESIEATISTIDQYSFAKSHLLIATACAKLSPSRSSHLDRAAVLALTQTIASNLTFLRQSCLRAGENKQLKELQKNQFSSCVQCFDGVSATFVTAVKAYINSGKESDRTNLYLFTKPLISAVDSIKEYACLAEFAGSPARLTPRGEQSQTAILAGSMAVVSSSVQLLNTVSGLLEHWNINDLHKAKKKHSTEEKHWTRLVSCARSVADSCKILALSIKEHTPRPSPQMSRTRTPSLQSSTLH